MGNGNDGISGPSIPERACNTFCRGGVIPFVIGAYGETNEDFQEVLKVCARMAVARGDAAHNSPIFETEVVKGVWRELVLSHPAPMSSSACRCHCPRSLPAQEVTIAFCSRLEGRGS